MFFRGHVRYRALKLQEVATTSLTKSRIQARRLAAGRVLLRLAEWKAVPTMALETISQTYESADALVSSCLTKHSQGVGRRNADETLQNIAVPRGHKRDGRYECPCHSTAVQSRARRPRWTRRCSTLNYSPARSLQAALVHRHLSDDSSTHETATSTPFQLQHHFHP